MLLARVRAAPADGAANENALRLLATTLDAPRSALRLVSGASARRKLIDLDDRYRDRLAELWPELLL